MMREAGRIGKRSLSKLLKKREHGNRSTNSSRGFPTQIPKRLPNHQEGEMPGKVYLETVGDKYKVTRTKNLTKPRIGQILSEEEVDKLLEQCEIEVAEGKSISDEIKT
jgi:hypothetical protein